MALTQQIDYMRKLSTQGGEPGPRIVYAKAGTLPSAAVLEDQTAVIDHKAYWTKTRNAGEARYLAAVVNSETARARVAPMQSRGQGGARDFDNLVWELRIPEYSAKVRLHTELAAAAAIAGDVAAKVVLTEGAYFTSQRRATRDALSADGISTKIDRLVTTLLDG